jgi:hypothetical protein
MNNFQEDDAIGRSKFKTDFGHYYKFQDTQEFDHTDLYMTGCSNGCRYDVEIKNRSYCIDEISDSTIMEKIKLDHFREVYRQDNDRCLIYFNYMLDGYISYDMTGRIKYNEGLCNTGTMMLPATTSEDNGLREKAIVGLCYTTSMYINDKIKYYDKNY